MPRDANPDGRGVDAGPDAGDATTNTGDAAAPAPCTVALSGTAPFERALSGSGEFTSPALSSPQVQAFAVNTYFPSGRTPGARMYVAHRVSWPVVGWQLTWTTLRDDLGASGIVLTGSDGRDFSLDAELLPGDGGVRAIVGRNFSDPSTDVAIPATATMSLCPTDSAPTTPTLTGGATRLAPTEALHLFASVPVDSASVAVTVRAGGVAVPVNATVDVAGLLIEPAAAFPPGLDLTVDTSAVRDVMGRPFTLGSIPPPLATTAVVGDLTFGAGVPAGALATDGPTQQSNGELVLGLAALQALPAYSALLALGDPGAATQVRVRARLECFYQTTYTTAALVSATGAASALALACGASATDLVVPVPGPGPLFLSVRFEPPASRPQWSPPPPSAEALHLDEIAFE